jgi:hypothetical protein
MWFDDLGLKITTMVSWFVPQNQSDFSLSVAPQNRREGDGVGHTSRSNGFLRVEVRLEFFQFASKLVESRRRVVHVVPLRRSREDKLKTDGSMQRAASDLATLDLPFLLYYALEVF